jgi:hypothetical protein
VRKVRGELAELSKQDPDEVKVVMQRLTRDLATRIHSTADPELANRLLHAAREIFASEPLFRAD